MEPYTLLLHWVRVDLSEMALKGYSTLPKSLEVDGQVG